MLFYRRMLKERKEQMCFSMCRPFCVSDGVSAATRIMSELSVTTRGIPLSGYIHWLNNSDSLDKIMEYSFVRQENMHIWIASLNSELSSWQHWFDQKRTHISYLYWYIYLMWQQTFVASSMTFTCCPLKHCRLLPPSTDSNCSTEFDWKTRKLLEDRLEKEHNEQFGPHKSSHSVLPLASVSGRLGRCCRSVKVFDRSWIDLLQSLYKHFNESNWNWSID